MLKFKYIAMTVGTIVALGAGCTTTTTPTTEVPTVNTTKIETVDTVTTNTVVEDNQEVDVTKTTNTSELTDVIVEPTIQTFDITASQFTFNPSTITVQRGDTVVLNITSQDVPHGFTLSEFGVNETLTPGKTTTVQFVADQVGTFNYSCSVVCGSGHSTMAGQLVVE